VKDIAEVLVEGFCDDNLLVLLSFYFDLLLLSLCFYFDLPFYEFIHYSLPIVSYSFMLA